MLRSKKSGLDWCKIMAQEKKERLTKIKIVPIEFTYQKYEKGSKPSCWNSRFYLL